MIEASIDGRRVVMPATKIYRADSNSTAIRFTAARYYGETDLADLDVYVKFKRIDGQTDKIKLISTIGEEQIVFIWTLGIVETCFEGLLQAQISFESKEQNFALNTEIFTIEILESISGYEYVGETPFDTSVTGKFVKKINVNRYLKPTIQRIEANTLPDVLEITPNTLTDVLGAVEDELTIKIDPLKWEIGDMANIFFTIDGGEFVIDDDSMTIAFNGVSVNSGFFYPMDGQRYELVFYSVGDKITASAFKA